MNNQREAFQKKVAEHKPGGEMQHEGEGQHSSPAVGTSTVTHHEDGSHSVSHHDGEKTHHPTAAHMGMHMAGKHDGGEHGHIAPHPAGATTHHVGMDGEVQGPHDHGSEEEAYSHLKGSIGDGAEMGEHEPAGMGGHEEETESSFE